MPEIQLPFTFEDLPVKPPLKGRPRITDDIQQALASLVGWDGSTRRLIKCSPTGALYFVAPPVKGITNVLANQTDYVWQGGDIPVSEVLILAHPDNTGKVWANFAATAAVDTGYPLDAGDWVTLTVANLKSLNLFIAIDTEKAIVVYTK